MSGTAASLRALMYGEGNLGATSLFSGDFINFGLWPEPTPGPVITVAERTESQAALYRLVCDRLGISPGDVVLEVGCGIGAGADLVLREYGPRTLHGLDLSPAQLGRARRVNAAVLAETPDRLVLTEGSALDMPHPDGMFDGLYSVEAAQHFDSLRAFATEAHRVLRPGGRAVITTFFTPGPHAHAELAGLIETVASGVDAPHPVEDFRADLVAAGFTDVTVESIGARVWPGFDAWIAHTEYRGGWGRNWLTAHERGLIDYHLITAERP